MIIDANELEDNHSIRSRVCIVGGGVAGITLALELEKQGISSIILEGGGEQYESESQLLYRGKNLGKKYYSMDTARLRWLGGTSNHWGGNCRELDELDFETRDWVNHSGWPISKRTLDDFYLRAKAYLRLDKQRGFEAEEWQSDFQELPKRSKTAKLRVTQFAPETYSDQSFRGLNFATEYYEKLRSSQSITVYLHANVCEVVPAPTDGRITSIKVKNFTGSDITVLSDDYILAAGGIENARILLASNQVVSEGVGNQNDLVGRYFMEHLSVNFGLMTPAYKDLAYYNFFEVPGKRINPKAERQVRMKGYISFDREVLEKERMLNTSVSIKRKHLPLSHSSAGYRSLRRLIGDLKAGVFTSNIDNHLGNILTGMDDIYNGLSWKYFSREEPVRLYQLGMQVEQSPNKDSRIILSREKDQLGVARANLDWKLTEMDYHTIRQTAKLVALEFGKTSAGRVKISLPDDNEKLDELILGDWHHMGTTRMSDNPKLGVTDQNCRVFGYNNLYISGSSVFPTGGHSVPTYTIIALAIRLADYIAKGAHGG